MSSEFKTCKDLTFAMLLPPPDEYVNIHPNCFHLWEIDDE